MTAAIGRNIPPQRLITMVNPIVRAVLQSPLHRLLDGALLILHIAGRKTGRRYSIPVSYVDLDGKLIVITQHSWRVNARGGVDLEVTHRGHNKLMHGELDENPPTVALTLHRAIGSIGWKAAQRQFGLKVNAGRTPDLRELEDAVREFDLAGLTLTTAHR
jgi:hypothetical protein